ncbi:hypothetical protein RHMOL_Rhmol03G0258000 [Rhododendron molle]|uniref:Uncharacterized protein n=1 Tax=Rhododendron molle TaxID=49168 RepID=A0ACC0PIY3_RHOML|nr:hypothetical protein RHMOL_Rhmol03G0258000 [Rhododendron molle]
MADSNDSISVDMETIYLGGKEHTVRTGQGSVSVIVYGDQDKPALLTYPDLALNHMSCFQGLFFCPEAASLLLHNFCIYHISPPGHELGAAALCPDDPVPSVDDLADQIIEVLNYFRLGAVMCMGVTAGAYVLTLFAMKYRERVLGLILVSPLCKTASWTEWLCNKLLDERQSINVSRFLQAIERSSFCPSWWAALLGSSPLPHGPLSRDSVPGPGLWIGGNGRATTCDVGTNGVFPHGLRIIQAVPVQRQPKESPQPVVHLPRASLSREHGLKAETYQDSDPYPCQKCIQIIFRKDKDFTIGMYTNSTCVFFSFFGFFLLGRCGGL